MLHTAIARLYEPVPLHSRRTHMHVKARCIGSVQKDYAFFDVVSRRRQPWFVGAKAQDHHVGSKRLVDRALRPGS